MAPWYNMGCSLPSKQLISLRRFVLDQIQKVDFEQGEVRPLWYPRIGFKSFVLGRCPDSTEAFEINEAVHWKIPGLPRYFSRRILGLFCCSSGNLCVVRLTLKNSIVVSASRNSRSGITLKPQELFTIPKSWLYNMTINIQGLLMFSTQSVGQSGSQSPRILSISRSM